MWHRFTERARQTVFAAHELATARNDFLVCPEDLVIGALKADRTACRNMLEKAGIPPDDFIAAVSAIERESGKPGFMGQVGLSDSGKKAVEYGMEESKRLASSELTSEHLFLGAIRVSPEIQEILKEKGLVVNDLRQNLIELLDEPETRP